MTVRTDTVDSHTVFTVTETVHGEGFTLDQAILNLQNAFSMRLKKYAVGDSGDSCDCEDCTCGKKEK